LKRKFKRTDDSPFHHFPCIFHKFHDDKVKEETWFTLQAASFYDAGYKNWCPAMTNALTMVEPMLKSSVAEQASQASQTKEKYGKSNFGNCITY
jgi:hypothetical protein